MNVHEQIARYISDLPRSKSEEMLDLHRRITSMSPDCRLWFLDGRNADGKVVSNPNIGYGAQMIRYAKGGQREFYKVGLSANESGISIYIMGVDDKTYLAETYGSRLGKATITGYCIRFRTAKGLDAGVLDEIIAEALGVAT